MEKDGLIVRTTEDDWSMIKWANAQGSEAENVMNLTGDDMRLLLAGHKLISNDDIFNILKKKGRLYSDKYLLNAGFTISKPRSVEQIQELFGIGEKESVYQEFIFHCERRIYFLRLCHKIISHLDDILRVYDLDHLLSSSEWHLSESIPYMHDLCSEGIDNAKTLTKEYHTYYTARNDALYNTKSGKGDGFSFRDSLIYYFFWLNHPHLVEYRKGFDSIDSSLEAFFHAITDSKTKEGCIKGILQGEEMPRDTKVLPLSQAERNFINAFDFLD